MNQSILVGMSIVIILFVWVWIALVILNRLSLEKRIEKLENITNPLPEEERVLNHLAELRAIEQNKVSSARWILVLFGLLLVGGVSAVAFYAPLYDIFGSENLQAFAQLAIAVLAFFILPTLVGLSLAGSASKGKKQGKQGQADKASAA